MSSVIKDPLVVMEFPISEGDAADKNSVVRALIERKAEIENIFAKDEFIKLDITHQELVGIKSTSTMIIEGGEKLIGDLPALNYVISHSEKYKGSKIINIGNVSTLYHHYSV